MDDLCVEASNLAHVVISAEIILLKDQGPGPLESMAERWRATSLN
jgi:hypothetical protein